MASLRSFPCPYPHKSFPFHHSSAASKLSCWYISKGEASKIGPWWMRELFVPFFVLGNSNLTSRERKLKARTLQFMQQGEVMCMVAHDSGIKSSVGSNFCDPIHLLVC